MEKLISTYLEGWLSQPGRKPLILRGARQMGKTWLIRDLASRSKLNLVELNFERNPEFRKYFLANDLKQILGDLSLALGKEIPIRTSLLFLDEIQAAGSLLEFTLTNHEFSMPFGRVSFRYVEPLGFREFLKAHGQERLLTTITDWRPGQTLSVVAHESAQHWFERFSMVGGMQDVVAADVSGATPMRYREMQKDLLAAFRADFAKYSGRIHADILDTVLRTVAGALGRKFVYAHADAGLKQH